MTTYANSRDVADRLPRDLTQRELDWVEVRLDDAWTVLTGPDKRPSLAADIAAGGVTAEQVRRVLCDMVLRIVGNPDGKVSESIDDYTYRRSDAVADGSLYVSDAELASVTPAAAAASAGAFTIRQLGNPHYVGACAAQFDVC